MSLQKALPVITSILIIFLVAVLRERSKTLAAILATMPINMPLALWVLVSGGADDATLLANYARSFIIGLVPAFIWLGIVYFALKMGWSLLGAIAGGYVIWVLLIAGLLWSGVLSVPN